MATSGLMLAVCAALAAPAAALAAAIPGATYTGTASDGASVTFTISSDGTLVQSYAIRAIHGTDIHGDGCLLFSAGDEGVWPGAPIGDGGFDWAIGSSFDFQGTFGDQSASGSFLVDEPAIGASTGCATGTVTWTAATTAADGSSGGGSSGGGSPGGGTSPGSTTTTTTGSPTPSGTTTGGAGTTGSSNQKRRWIGARVSLSKLSHRQLGGRVRSSNTNCRADRTVYLWRGKRRLGHTRATKQGSYAFKLSAAVRGKAVRASVVAVTTRGVSCAAASSAFIGA